MYVADLEWWIFWLWEWNYVLGTTEQEVDFAAANVLLLFCRSKLFTKLYQICIHYILFDVLGMYYVGIQFIIKPLQKEHMSREWNVGRGAGVAL